MAQTPEAALELPIGVTDQKAIQTVVRMVGRIQQESRKAEQAAVKANEGITRSFTNMSRQSRAQIQNVSYQLQDIFVQISGGTSASRALSQQLPQLLGGFGALGAVLGTVAAAAIPLAASFFTSGEKAKGFEDRLKQLRETIEAYRADIASANLTHAELAEKYAGATEEAKKFLAVLRDISGERANSAAASEAQGIASMFGGFGQGADRAYSDLTELQATVKRVREELGLAQPEAVKFVAALQGLARANTPQEYVAALGEINDLMKSVTVEGDEQKARFTEVQEQVAKIGDQMGSLVGATAEVTGEADTLASAMAGVRAEVDAINSAIRGLASAIASLDVSNVGKAAQLAALQAGKSASDAAIEGKLATRRAELGGVFGPNNANITGLERELTEYETQLREDASLSAAIDGIIKARSKTGGGSKRKAGARGKKEYTVDDLLDSAERDLTNLERQFELLGKNTEQAEALRAKWQLLDEAKRRGLTVDESLNAEIERQSAAIGQMAAEYEKAAEAADFYRDMNEQAKDGFIDAIVEGESLAGVLGDVAKAFAKAALQAALFGQGPLSGGMGGLLSFLPGFSSGGFTGGAGRNQVTGVVHGGEYVMSAPAVQRIGLQNLEALHNGGSVGGQPKITINNNAPGAVVSADYVTKDEVILTVSQAIAANSRGQSDRQYLRSGR
ncbi:hypothetical protein [Paracoccus sp. (in: a-proteobacteria)]|uniref:hypothetical protein n=1 Tax=Paracoccus sp. TaxID=267 RepID=UPI002AFE5CBE|nr:hypothetical protein [Paracoccus sp. (in: a-proteobacteria)]